MITIHSNGTGTCNGCGSNINHQISGCYIEFTATYTRDRNSPDEVEVSVYSGDGAKLLHECHPLTWRQRLKAWYWRMVERNYLP